MMNVKKLLPVALLSVAMSGLAFAQSPSSFNTTSVNCTVNAACQVTADTLLYAVYPEGITLRTPAEIDFAIAMGQKNMGSVPFDVTVGWNLASLTYTGIYVDAYLTTPETNGSTLAALTDPAIATPTDGTFNYIPAKDLHLSQGAVDWSFGGGTPALNPSVPAIAAGKSLSLDNINLTNAGMSGSKEYKYNIYIDTTATSELYNKLATTGPSDQYSGTLEVMAQAI